MNLADIRRKAQEQEPARTEREEAPAPVVVDPAAPPESAVELLQVPAPEIACLPCAAASIDPPEEAFPRPVLECVLEGGDEIEDLDDLDAYALAVQQEMEEVPSAGAVADDAAGRFEAVLQEALQHPVPAPVADLSRPSAAPAPAAPSAPVPPLRAPQQFDPVAAILKGRETAATGEDAGTAAEEESAASVELLCFKVAQEEYAISIMDVKEIIKPRELTEVPRTPPFVGGVLSLRGIIIPVFDLRVRLGLFHEERSPRERIVVVKRERGFCGVLVDQVVQVVRLPLAGIEPPPVVLEGIDRDFVRGIGRVEGRMLILLDMDKVLDVTLS